MRTTKPDQSAMRSRIVRFAHLAPARNKHVDTGEVPEAVLAALGPKYVYNLLGPVPDSGQAFPRSKVEGGDGGAFRISIAKCPPGNGARLHVHWKSRESFLALTGLWDIRWGDKREERVVLEPFDLISFLPGVCREFTNIDASEAHLLIVNEGNVEDFGDVDRPAATARMVAARFGDSMLQTLKRLGWTFNLETGE